MAQRIRAYDWASTPLGPIATWPRSLRVAVEMCVSSVLSTSISWGPDFTMIFNDAGAAMFPERVDTSLGRPFSEVFKEVWPILGPRFQQIMDSGEAVMFPDTPLLPPGTVVPESEERFYTLTYAPLRDDEGRIAGVISTSVDTTERVLGNRHREAAEAAARVNESRLQAALDAAAMGTFIWHIEANRLEADTKLLSLFGVAPERASSPTLSPEIMERVHPDDRDPYGLAVATAITRHGSGLLKCDLRVRHPEGERWLSITGQTHFDTQTGAPVRLVGAALDISERKAAEESLSVLVAELQHRTRNLIAVVSALADKTVRESDSMAAFQGRFGDRLAAVSRVQSLLSTLAEGERISFDELIRTELAAHAATPSQVVLEGPAGIPLRSGSVQTFALALHELATNAVKYGALSTPCGRLTVRWRLEPGPQPHLHVDWRETGVAMPEGTPQQLSGYGRELIERALPYQMKARTTYAFESDGVRCTIAAPIAGET